MYESYSKQALPSKEYRELLGSALCVFNSNNAFIVENILRFDTHEQFNWYKLIDAESGQLKPAISSTITKVSGNVIANLFDEIVIMRNRIAHSFQVTKNDEQILATKTRMKNGNEQFIITKEYFLEFIEKNEKLSSALHKLRGY